MEPAGGLLPGHKIDPDAAHFSAGGECGSAFEAGDRALRPAKAHDEGEGARLAARGDGERWEVYEPADGDARIDKCQEEGESQK